MCLCCGQCSSTILSQRVTLKTHAKDRMQMHFNCKNPLERIIFKRFLTFKEMAGCTELKNHTALAMSSEQVCCAHWELQLQLSSCMGAVCCSGGNLKESSVCNQSLQPNLCHGFSHLDHHQTLCQSGADHNGHSNTHQQLSLLPSLSAPLLALCCT